MANFVPFTPLELGQQDFERGEPRGSAWPDRAAGWDAAYRDSLEKAVGGLRRMHAGRYESDDGRWAIVETSHGHWSLLSGIAPGLRTQIEVMGFPTFAAAMDGLRAELKGHEPPA